jgi:hypothetical protein
VFLDSGKQEQGMSSSEHFRPDHLFCIGEKIALCGNKLKYSTPLGLRLQDLPPSGFSEGMQVHGQLKKNVRLRSENSDKKKTEKNYPKAQLTPED